MQAELRRRTFRVGGADEVGSELELTPLAVSGDRFDLDRALESADRLWVEWPESDGAEPISWRGGNLTREPGGQWEISGPPLPDPETAADAMVRAAGALRALARHHQFDFIATGFHPWASAEAIGLRKHTERYQNMQAYFDTIGPDGRRMMRQTGSVQVAVDHGRDPRERLERWELAQRLSPVLTAAFANSAVCQGRPGPIPGLRGATWLHLDPARTGIPRRFLDDPAGDPILQYLDFALNAPLMFVHRLDGHSTPLDQPVTFAEWLDEGLPEGFPDRDDWETHLSTLFPDVRPRGYLEVRAMDAPGMAWLSVPILVVGHVLRDATARRTLLERLRPEHDQLLDLRVRAVERALADPTLRDAAIALFQAVRPLLRGDAERVVRAYEERFLQPGVTPGEVLRDRITPGDTLLPGEFLGLRDEWSVSAGEPDSSVPALH